MVVDNSAADIELVRLAQQGTIEAFTLLYERYLPVVYRRVRCVVPEADVEDVTQEVFVAVVKSLKNFRGDSLFSTWLRTLTNRQVADYYRRRNHQIQEYELDANDGDCGEPDLPAGELNGQEGIQLDDRLLLRQAIGRLPENYREILVLRFAEGLKFSDIAAQQGQTLECIKSLFRRAVAALQKQLEGEHV